MPLLDRTPTLNPGVGFILEESLRYSPYTRLVILVLGAATDVASALLIDPSLGDRNRDRCNGIQRVARRPR